FRFDKHCTQNKLVLVPTRMAKSLDDEIERTRREIADLQKRIRDTGFRRVEKEAKSDRKNYPQIVQIDEQIDHARRLIRNSPQSAKSLAPRIAALDTERYRLLLTLED